MFFHAATSLAVLLAIFVYRSGRVAWHHILTKPNLPSAYYVGGDPASHCAHVHDPTSPDLAYCEDIVFWDHHDDVHALTSRLVLLGCDPNRKAWNTVMGPLRDPNPRGHLFLYEPGTGEVRRLVLAGYPDGHDFHPLGMAAYPSVNGSTSNLFVVNHARARTTIEQFVLDPDAAWRAREARHVRTLSSPYFVSPNAIALTGPTSFFVSNDHLMTRRLPSPAGHVLPLVESVAGLPLGWVSHVSLHRRSADDDDDDGSDVTVSHTFSALGISFANGLALSPDRTHLAVASTSLGLVLVYAVVSSGDGVSGGRLAYSHSVPVPFFPDNLMYDDDGALVVAGHPHFPALVGVAANKTGVRAPSWAVSLTPLSDATQFEDARARAYDERAPVSAAKFAPAVTTHEVETLFQSDGSVFGSSSTTLRDSRTGTIYIAGLYEEGMLVCRP